MRRSKKNRVRKWEKDWWARIFALFREYNLRRLQSKQEESAKDEDQEEMKQQQRIKLMNDRTKKHQVKRKNGR